MADMDAPKPVFAIVTTKTKDEVQGGVSPVFYVQTREEQEHIAMWISRIANVAVHDLHDGTMLLIPI